MILRTVELFAGIGGFRIASDQVGIETVWANDLNPLSASVYRDRFGGDCFSEGDIESHLSSIPSHDILTAGFPCQPFSSAGKKKGIRDPRGTLFESIVKVVSNKRPAYFILENVKRLLSMENGEHFATVLSAFSELDYFIEWRLLNAKNFGLAQNRERVLVIGTKADSSFDQMDFKSRVRLLCIDDIKEAGSKIPKMLADRDAWRNLDGHGLKFPSWGVSYRGRFIAHGVSAFSDSSPSVLLKDVLQKDAGPEFDLTEATLPRLKNSELVQKMVNGVEIVSNQGGGARMGYTIFGVTGLAPTLTASTSRHYERYLIDGKYRRLTPVEYARLMGFPDHHCSAVKSYDQYYLYGNAVPPPMVKWVLERMLSNDSLLGEKDQLGQVDMFYG